MTRREPGFAWEGNWASWSLVEFSVKSTGGSHHTFKSSRTTLSSKQHTIHRQRGWIHIQERWTQLPGDHFALILTFTFRQTVYGKIYTCVCLVWCMCHYCLVCLSLCVVVFFVLTSSPMILSSDYQAGIHTLGRVMFVWIQVYICTSCSISFHLKMWPQLTVAVS